LLIELLVVLAVLVMISAIMDRYWMSLSFELPRESRLIQENISLNDAIRHIQADVASAENLENDINEPNTLTIELKKGTVFYKFDEGRIIRSKSINTQGDTIWKIPHGKIQCQVLKKGDRGYAVEIKSCIEDDIFGKTQRKMANSNLFFAGAIWETAQ